MAYATVRDLITRYGEAELVRLTTPQGQDMDGIVDAVAQAALDDATAMVDSYMARRYRTPMDIAPPIVIKVCCDIARFDLSTGDGKVCGEEVRTRHTDALKWLKDVSLGTVVIEAEQTSPDTAESGAMVTVGRGDSFGGRW